MKIYEKASLTVFRISEDMNCFQLICSGGYFYNESILISSTASFYRNFLSPLTFWLYHTATMIQFLLNFLQSLLTGCKLVAQLRTKLCSLFCVKMTSMPSMTHIQISETVFMKLATSIALSKSQFICRKPRIFRGWKFKTLIFLFLWIVHNPYFI